MNYLKKILLFVLLFSNIVVLGQVRALYHIPNIQQSTLINPAIQHKCKLYVGLPAISSTLFNINHTGFTYNDVFIPLDNGLYAIDIERLEKKIRKWNYIKSQVQVNIFALGYKYENYYFSLDISNKTDLKVGYPDDYINITHGNGYFMGDNYLQLVPFLTAVNYNEIAFGASQQLSANLTIGGKFKYLQGVANTQITNSYAKLYTDEDTYDLFATAKIEANSSFPVTITYDTLNLPSDIVMNEINITKDFIFNNNRGAAIDLGMIYKFSEEITFSGSILDLGFIRWASNTNTYQGEGELKFVGFDVASWYEPEMISDNYNYDSIRVVLSNKYIDSLQNAYSLNYHSYSYFSFLHTKIYLGATYQLIPYLNFGVLTRTAIYNKRIYPSLTLSANGNFWKNRIQTSLSYSIMNNSFRNLGFGLAFKLGPVQLYTVSDNFLGIFNWKNSRSFSMQFGLNLYFGCKERKKGYNSKNNRKKRSQLCPAYQ